MNSRLLRITAACVLIVSLLLNACQPGTAPIAVAADQSYAGRRVTAPDCKYGGNLRSVQAVDRYTVKFSLCKPDPALPTKLAFPVFSILDEANLEFFQGNPVLMDARPNGTGPYIVSDFRPGSGITLQANPAYWGPPVKTQTLEIRWSSSAQDRQTIIQSAEADGIDRPSPRELDNLESNPELKVYPRPSLNTFYIGMNNKFSPFDKAGVREAFATAIDRSALLDALFLSGTELAEQFLSPAFTPGYTPGYRWFDANPNQAYDMLLAAGFDFVRPISLAYSTAETDYLADPAAAAEAVRDQLNAIGIQINPVPMDPSEFKKSVLAGEQAFFLSGWSANYPDASDFYQSHFTSENLQFGNPYPDLDFMVRQVASAFDDRDRQYRFNRINEIIRLHVPAIPVAHATTAIVLDADVQNVLIGPLNENFEEMTTPDDRLVFVQSAAPVHLWPGNAADSDTLRVSRLIYDSLLAFEFGGTGLKPNLAEHWESNTD
ncbi:MAG TPA: ABC transporter substrate-binding protein, partial [Anaerolineaceae bacterium]|nr:ABC transporter substrate-binding protein [Anaerolineaceae bacterium]